jgi:hypothetical protein
VTPAPGRAPRRPARRVARAAARAATAAGLVGMIGLAGTLAPSPPAGASPPGPLTVRQLRTGAGHACIVGGSSPPTVAWSQLRNPILSEPSAGVKDQAIVWAAGTWHMFFSYVTEDPSLAGGVRWDIASATSPDLAHWSSARPWSRQPGVEGVASPDIVRDPGSGYVVTYQSDPGASPPSRARARLFYRTSSDLEHWSAPHALAPGLAPAQTDRMIDAALVFTGHQLLLGFKYSSPSQPDVFELARSTTGRLPGPWRLVGRPDISVDGGTVENYEFVAAAGRWRLLATSDNLDQPWLFTLAPGPDDAQSWLHWIDGYPLVVPAEAFNTGPGISSIGFERANSAYLCATGAAPGQEVYLLYAGSPELTQFGGWGHAAIGVAESRDLRHWQVPPG